MSVYTFKLKGTQKLIVINRILQRLDYKTTKLYFILEKRKQKLDTLTYIKKIKSNIVEILIYPFCAILYMFHLKKKNKKIYKTNWNIAC